MSALAQEGNYEHIDREHFKELIGNLNWNKFAERIANQLSTNMNLTAEQKKLMQVNLVVALIRSNQHEQALKEADKISKEHNAWSGIKAYFLIKDRKYDEALQVIKANKNDSYTVFLRAQIYLAKSNYFNVLTYLYRGAKAGF